MLSIFQKLHESLLAGLGFTFQPIRKNSPVRTRKPSDEQQGQRQEEGLVTTITTYDVYKLYENLIANQAFNQINLQIMYEITKECLSVIENGLPTETDRWDFDEYFLLIFALLTFYSNLNYTGPELSEDTLPEEFRAWLNTEQDKALQNKPAEICNTSGSGSIGQDILLLDGEDLVDNIKYPIIIVLVERILHRLESKYTSEQFYPDPIKEDEDPDENKNGWNPNYAFILWWHIRTRFLHQQFLEERSQILFNDIVKSETKFRKLIQQMEKYEIVLPSPLKAMFYVELSEIYLYYYDIEKAKHFVELAKNTAEIKATPTGVLGKRTKFQQIELAQLVLQVDILSGTQKLGATFQSADKSTFPQNIPLEDEVRLEKVEVSTTPENPGETKSLEVTAGHLTPLQHLVILADFRAKSKYLPQDGVHNEELLAYLQYLIEFPKLWCVQFLALFKRSLLETDHSRTVERSMKQLQALKTCIEQPNPVTQERTKCFFGSGLPFRWEVERGLSRVLLSLGIYKEALDISLRLNAWEDIINCYNLLNLRHKAEEVIRAELEKNPESVKLWIYLGDATDNVEFYEKAWNISKCKSSRAQRQWGYYYFSRKEYDKSIEHFDLSVQLNPLDQLTWIRLGYAALECEKWELATKAYQHATELDSENFELWNNLAKAFLKSGDKLKALRAFREAIKCNYENWKVWENLMVVAIECKSFDDVIRSYNRLIDLKTKWEDEEVLTLLVHGLVVQPEVTEEPSDNFTSTIVKSKCLKDTLKLFGRITSSVRGNPTIWKLYSDLQAVVAASLKESRGQGDGPAEDTPETHLHNSVTYLERAIKCCISDPNWNKTEPKIKKATEFVPLYVDRILDFQQYQSNLTNPGSSEQLKTEAQFLLKKVFNGIKQTSQTAINMEPFQTEMQKLQEQITRLGFSIE